MRQERAGRAQLRAEKKNSALRRRSGFDWPTFLQNRLMPPLRANFVPKQELFGFKGLHRSNLAQMG
jgi:hypothetical protein